MGETKLRITVRLDQNFRVSEIERGLTLDWIGDYKAKNLQTLPPLPSYLLPLVNYYTKGQPISPSIEVIAISGQQWQEFSSQQRNELLELVEFTGQDINDYVKLFQSQYPKTPRGKS